jgi:hypothetical protein
MVQLLMADDEAVMAADEVAGSAASPEPVEPGVPSGLSEIRLDVAGKDQG